MDAKGWISIATLSNFNRVKQLTHDYQFVKHVLTLSNFVMVREDWVRMHGWEGFVLPNAPASTVELSEASGNELSSERVEGAEGSIKSEEAEHGEAEAEEEEEEEDVVFVMGQEAGWSPQGTRRQT
jgi:la-related protein 1